jgi:hypothetical protein
MMTKCLPGLLCLLAHISLVSSSDDVDHGLVEWLNSLEGGYFNPKQEIRREDTNDSNSMVGIFAKELIEEGELLNQVPWDAIITSEGNEDEDDDEETSLHCGTARNVAEEMRLGPEGSEYGPYIGYLLTQREGQIPSAWSKEGQNLLLDILGGKTDAKLPPLDAVSWLEDDWYGSCNGDRNDAFAAHAAMLVVQRADDDFMVPVYDLYNHRNGDYFNTRLTNNEGVNQEMRARRTIQPGEQLHNSYNLCDICGGRAEGYGTPGTLFLIDLNRK